MPNNKIRISSLNLNLTPTKEDVFPINNNGVTKKMSLSGLTEYINNEISYFTGVTYSNNDLTFIDNSGNLNIVNIDNFTGLTINGSLSGTTISGGTFYGDGSNLTGIDDYYITGGTYDNANGSITFKNKNGETFSVTGITTNTKHWLDNENKIVNSDETIVISGNYVLSGSTLTLNSDDINLTFGNINFNKYGQIFIGGYLLLIDSDIVNNGLISVAGAIILSGNSTIIGSGIII